MYLNMPQIIEKLHSLCDDFVAFKHAKGIRYDRQERYLRRFLDSTAAYLADKVELPKEMILAWNSVKGMEKPKTRSMRVNTVRAFAEYLSKRGVPAFICAPPRYRESDFVPYIFTNDELARFFSAADNRRINRPKANKHLTMPMIMRTLYACGLRREEIVRLRICDVDLEKGIMTVLDSKFGKDRLIPIDHSFLQRLRNYAAIELRADADKHSPFFPTSTGSFYSGHSIYIAFRKFLLDAGISHGGKGHGPRIHDLRHTFAVHCLRKWVRNGNDIDASVPYLAAYMGHTHFRHSQVYLRLTADMFPDIVSKLEQNFDVFPKWEGNYEAD
jgi:integrase